MDAQSIFLSLAIHHYFGSSLVFGFTMLIKFWFIFSYGITLFYYMLGGPFL